jgi:hypothetical protein
LSFFLLYAYWFSLFASRFKLIACILLSESHAGFKRDAIAERDQSRARGSVHRRVPMFIRGS